MAAKREHVLTSGPAPEGGHLLEIPDVDIARAMRVRFEYVLNLTEGGYPYLNLSLWDSGPNGGEVYLDAYDAAEHVDADGRGEVVVDLDPLYSPAIAAHFKNLSNEASWDLTVRARLLL